MSVNFSVKCVILHSKSLWRRRNSKKLTRLTGWEVSRVFSPQPCSFNQTTLFFSFWQRRRSRAWSEERNQRADCRAPAISILRGNFSLFKRRRLRHPLPFLPLSLFLSLAISASFLSSSTTDSIRRNVGLLALHSVIPLNWNFIKLCLFSLDRPLFRELDLVRSLQSTRFPRPPHGDFFFLVLFLTIVWQVARANSVSLGWLGMETWRLIRPSLGVNDWRTNVASTSTFAIISDQYCQTPFFNESAENSQDLLKTFSSLDLPLGWFYKISRHWGENHLRKKNNFPSSVF